MHGGRGPIRRHSSRGPNRKYARSSAAYQAGQAELLAGNTEEPGYARYLEAVNLYPQAYESYLALVALIEAGYAVDEFQRGLVDLPCRGL
jgi:hypothetical protein